METVVPYPDEPTLEYVLEHLTPKQETYLKCENRFAAYIGGFRAGKTVVGCADMMLFAQQHPGQYMVGRLNAPALQDTTMKTFLAMCPKDWVEPGGYLKQERKLIFKNGSVFLFRHLDVPDLQQHLRSMNLRGFLIDEGSEVNKDIFLSLQGRLSTGNPRIGRVVGNPDGHNWIWELFFDPKRKKVLLDKYFGITAASTENPNLPFDYIEDMKATYPPDWEARFIYASFADFTDAVWGEFNETIHGYDNNQEWPFFGGSGEPPLDWPVYVSVDIGGKDPWAWTFIAGAPNGMLFQFDEIHQAGILVQDLAVEYYRRMEGRELAGLCYDYENQQAAMELAEYGISGTHAIKQVKPGIFKTGQYIHIDPLLQNPFTGQLGSPRLFVSKNKCPNSIHYYSTYKWEKDKHGRPTGKPADVDADLPDSLRYNIHTFRPDLFEIPRVKAWQNPDLNEQSRLYWRSVEMQEERNKKRGNVKRRPYMRRIW